MAIPAVAGAYGAALGAIAQAASPSGATALPDRLVVAYPSHWADQDLAALRTATAVEGLPEPILVPRCVAAAAYLADDARGGSAVAIVDIGNSRADVDVLHRTPSGFSVIGPPGGLSHAAGDQPGVFPRRLAYELLATITAAGLTPSRLGAIYIIGDVGAETNDVIASVLGTKPRLVTGTRNATVLGAVRVATAAARRPRAKVPTTIRGRALLAGLAVIAVATAVVIGAYKATRTPQGSGANSIPPTPASSAPAGQKTATTSAACGAAGGPALAYATSTGTGAAASTYIKVRCGPGTTTTRGDETNDNGGPLRLAWSADGSQLGWTDGQTVTVVSFDAGTATTRNWTCQNCEGLAFLGKQAVTITAQEAGGPMRTTASPAPSLLVFPPSGNGQPGKLPVTGIQTLPTDSWFQVLGIASPTSVIVSYGDGGGSDDGGVQELYHVNAAGQASEYGTGNVSGAYNPDNARTSLFGSLSLVSENQAGSELALESYSRGGACGGIYIAYVINTATGALSIPKTPADGGPSGWTVNSVWFGQSGTPYVSLVPNLSTCDGTGLAPTGGLVPTGAAPMVCELIGNTWVKTGSGVFQAAYGPGDWLAEVTGVTGQYGSAPTTLTISDGTAGTALMVTHVSGFGWEPTSP